MLLAIARNPTTEKALYAVSAVSLTGAVFVGVYAVSQALLITGIAIGAIALVGALLARYARWSELPDGFSNVEIRLLQFDRGVDGVAIDGIEEVVWKTTIYGTPVEVRQTFVAGEVADIPLFGDLEAFVRKNTNLLETFDPDEHWVKKLTVSHYVKWLHSPAAAKRGKGELVLPVKWALRGQVCGEFNDRMRIALQAARAFLFSTSAKPTKISLCLCHWELRSRVLPRPPGVPNLTESCIKTPEQLQAVQKFWQEYMEQSATTQWANAFG